MVVEFILRESIKQKKSLTHEGLTTFFVLYFHVPKIPVKNLIEN